MKPIICAFFSIIVAFADFVAESFGQKEFSIADIAGKTPQEVAEILGDPVGKEVFKPSRTSCPCDKLTYRNGQIEIVFIKGRADWITINNMANAPYSKNSLSLLGLPKKDPAVSNFVQQD
jgi:hypothetical protein